MKNAKQNRRGDLMQTISEYKGVILFGAVGFGFWFVLHIVVTHCGGH